LRQPATGKVSLHTAKLYRLLGNFESLRFLYNFFNPRSCYL